jgi:hypothetical protein
MELGIATALAKRGGRRLRRNERLRAAAAKSLAADCHRDVDVIDEAFAGFTRVDAPVANDDRRHGENVGKFPAGLQIVSPNS